MRYGVPEIVVGVLGGDLRLVEDGLELLYEILLFTRATRYRLRGAGAGVAPLLRIKIPGHVRCIFA